MSLNFCKSSLQPALCVLLKGRSIFLKRLLPRDDGRVSGDAEPRPLLVSLPAVPGSAASTTTSSVELLVKKYAAGGSVVMSDFSREERGSLGRAELVRLGRGDGGGRDMVAGAADVDELAAVTDTDKVFDAGRLSSTPLSFVVHDLHCRTSNPAT